ncbi:MAG TPA: hypothetical protein VFS15_24430, partial [Kofleriaceae bacterium]|nr:hypothetical protein [Kofleriaceae bacterium]
AAAATAVRILCLVAVLRAVSFVVPPLLDGVGRPDRTIRYQTTAAITLPIMYVLGALALGGSLGFESVAVSWAVGYPVAFGVLIYMATHTIGWSALKYMRAVGGVVGCLFTAGALAAATRYAITVVSPAVELGIVSAVAVVSAGLLLAYTQGLSLRTALRSLRDSPPPPQTET